RPAHADRVDTGLRSVGAGAGIGCGADPEYAGGPDPCMECGAGPSRGGAEPTMSTRSVLLIDDDTELGTLLSDFLARYDIACLCAHKGRDGLKKLRDSRDRKSTRLNSSHVKISYAVFCLKKKSQKH